MSTNTVSVTAEEAEALFEAAEYARKNRWGQTFEEMQVLNSAIRKLRYADVLLLASYDNDPPEC